MKTTLVGLSCLIPLCAGWLIATRVWLDSPRLFRLALAWIIGSGIAGTAYFATLSLSNSKTISLVVGEGVLLVLIAILWMTKGTPRTFTVETGRASRLDEKIAGIAFLVSALLAMGAFVFISDYSRQGGWDAIAIWNAKARFITRSDAAPLDRIVDPKLAHADYPLLLPAIVARAWQYGGVDSTTISEGIAGLFTFSTFIIAFYAVKLLGGRASAYLMGCVLLSTPFFLVHGASQYADIVLACYITATAAMFTLWDSGIRSPHLPVIAGLFAGFAASTKNEGMLLLVVTVVARVFLMLVRKTLKDGVGEILRFVAGALPGLVALALFKLWHSPPSEMAGQMKLSVWLTRMQSHEYHSAIWTSFRNELHHFGSWWIWPIPLMLLYLIVSWIAKPNRRAMATWAMPGLVLLGMVAGYYMAYIVTPFDLQWHLNSSLSRLMLQVWPTALVFCFLVGASPKSLKES